VRTFEANEALITSDACRQNAARFSASRFRREFEAFVLDEWNRFAARRAQ
jgi:hypothetical protein